MIIVIVDPDWRFIGKLTFQVWAVNQYTYVKVDI